MKWTNYEPCNTHATKQTKAFYPNQKLAVEYPHDIKIPLKQNVANINGTWEHRPQHVNMV